MNKGMKIYTKKKSKNFNNRKKESGFIYLISAKKEKGFIYKVGYSNSPKRRIKQLQVDIENELNIVHKINTDDMKSLEKIFHTLFRKKNIMYCKQGNSEWFKLTEKDVNWFKTFKEFSFKSYELEEDTYGKALNRIYFLYYNEVGKDERTEVSTKEDIGRKIKF